MKPSELADALELSNQAYRDGWWVPSRLSLYGFARKDAQRPNGFSQYSDENAFLNVAGVEPGPSDIGMTLGRVHFARWIGQDIEERSCAVNTMAHEMSHALSHTKDTWLGLLLDTETNRTQPPAGQPIGSYLIGSAAQCVFLENAGQITGEAAFRTCLTTWGLTDFKSFSCKP